MSLGLTLDRMKRSLLMFLGSSGRYFMVWKKSTDMISATLQHDVGCLFKRNARNYTCYNALQKCNWKFNFKESIRYTPLSHQSIVNYTLNSTLENSLFSEEYELTLFTALQCIMDSFCEIFIFM